MSDSMRNEFERDGYAVLSGFLDASVVVRVRERVAALIDQVSRFPERWRDDVVYQSACHPGQLAHLPRDEQEMARKLIYIVGDLARHVPEAGRLLLSPLLAGIAEEALGEPVRFHFSNLTLRPARLGCSNAWHRDFPNRFCCGGDERQLRLFICLDGMSDRQGAVRVAAGSHRWSEAQWVRFRADASNGAKPAADVRTVECPPGSVMAVHCRTVHSVLPNVSDMPRANLIAQYGAAGNALVVGDYESG